MANMGEYGHDRPMSDHTHSKKHKKHALIARQRHQQQINQMASDQGRSRDLDQEREEEMRAAALESGRTAERAADGKPVWSAKVQMMKNKNTGKLRAADSKWNRFAGTEGGGGRGL